MNKVFVENGFNCSNMKVLMFLRIKSKYPQENRRHFHFVIQSGEVLKVLPIG